jgi:vitamin B12 transporter
MPKLRTAWCVLICLLITEIAGAQEADEIELDKIIVTNRRTEVGLSEVTENVVVITEEEINALPARNLGEALKYIAGVDIELRRGFGRPASVTIQGCDSRQVRVMIDGIPLNSLSSGQVDLAPFPIENIARIEVIKGAASSMWGSSLGGVINIITKDTAKTLIPQGSVTTTFSEFRTRKDSGEISGKVGGLGYYLFSSYMDSGGKGPKDDVLEKKAFSKLSYDLKDMGKIIATFGYSSADVNSGKLPYEDWQAQPYRREYGKIGWEKDFADFDLRVDFKHSRLDGEAKYYFTVDDAEPYLILRTDDRLYQLSLSSTIHPRDKDLLVLGADFDWGRLKSSYLSEAKDLNLQAPYANYTLKLLPWEFNFGLRYDHNSEYGQEVSPSLGAVYHLKGIPDTLIRANISRAFNAPPLLWKYYELILSSVTTNPDIKPERAWVYELGMESKPISKLWLKFSLYRADVTDAIAQARNELDQRYMKNFQKFRRQGAELQFKLNLLEELSLFGAAAFNDIVDRASGDIVKGGEKARRSFDLGIEYKNKKGFGVALKGYYDFWNEPEDSQANDQKMLCDLKISQEFKHLSLFLNIYNLANSKYWRDYYFPYPERYFEGGFTLKW